ncbi:immunoglobulin-like domain-containing protein [Paenibacillus sp. 32352]|uniref:immunoglobulin-like domain-containing protein n=1 Tax=Paenibacillus sp. 32352 TaxID=1969111 RepID=UPI0034CDEACE
MVFQLLFQKYNQSVWEDVPNRRAFTLEGIGLEPGKTYEQKVTINDLEPGKYRIIKEVSIMDIHDTKEALTADFEVVSPEHFPNR